MSDRKPSEAMLKAIEVLQGGNLPRVMIALDCGQLAALQCLCEPGMIDAAVVLTHNYSLRERDVIIGKLCGCAVAPPPPPAPIPTQGPGQIVPASNPAPATPAATPAAPVQTCITGLPPQGSYS